MEQLFNAEINAIITISTQFIKANRLLLSSIFFVFFFPPSRRQLVSRPIMALIKKFQIFPSISPTEKAAIDAGTVWIDGELFSGKPNISRILAEPYPKLTKQEQAFLDGPTQALCEMVSDWEITQRRDFPPKVWAFMKKEKFFGMIIPKKYGGLGFSAIAHSAVIAKLASRSTALAITIMVPNSLGPGELLTHYGTTEQKEHYLPRLATGKDIPCFALTEPEAGSDASAISSSGTVFQKKDGSLHIRLNWEKRYITLAAISTVLGLAFKLSDPQNLLGKGKDLGITCALIPSNSNGVQLGRRHDPLGVPFYNCPTSGKNVEIPISAIIGGEKNAGKGWVMLMESLAVGRGISLPSNCTGGAKLLSRLTGAYSAIREQFGTPIGKFEGIQDPLARIAASAYFLEANRRFTCGAIDKGAKPAVVTAISKYISTEQFRTIINDGMDILGGAAISRGPKNLLANPYCATPISITVEGANILTRSLIIFGQGAIRCHPYVLDEVTAVEQDDLKKFDRAFWGHIVHVIKLSIRNKLLFFTRGHLAYSPINGPMKPYIKKLHWASTQFALLADIAMATLGGNLKRKESLTGRFSDIFSWMLIATATIKRFEAEGRQTEDLPIAKWALNHAFHEIQSAFLGLFQNMNPLFKCLSPIMRLNPIGTPPSDKESHKLALLLQKNSKSRDRLTDGLFYSKSEKDPLYQLDHCLMLLEKVQPALSKIKTAIKEKQLKKASISTLIKPAEAKKIITAKEAQNLNEFQKLRKEIIQVDSFTLENYKKGRS